jgi:hypothetical protein
VSLSASPWPFVVAARARPAHLVLAALPVASPTREVWLPVLGVAILVHIVARVAARWYHPSRLRAAQHRYHTVRRLRDETLRRADGEKAARLAASMKSAELDAARAEYRVQGFLVWLLTRALPFILGLAYVDATYGAARLRELRGHEYLWAVSLPGGGAWPLGGVELYVIFVLALEAAIWLGCRARAARGRDRTGG